MAKLKLKKELVLFLSLLIIFLLNTHVNNQGFKSKVYVILEPKKINLNHSCRKFFLCSPSTQKDDNFPYQKFINFTYQLLINEDNKIFKEINAHKNPSRKYVLELQEDYHLILFLENKLNQENKKKIIRELNRFLDIHEKHHLIKLKIIIT